MENIAKTINIFLEAIMAKYDENASFNFIHPVIIDNTKIIIVPEDPNTSFIDAWVSETFINDEVLEDNTKTFGINFSVNIELIDTDNDNYYIDDITELGEIVIKLDANLEDQEGSAKFIDPIILNTEAQLEEAVDEDEAEEEEVDIESVTAEVITEDAFEDTENMTSWVITYDLNEMLTEDENEESPSNIDIIEAPDIETAVKYAEQSARIKAKEDPKWSDAEITSIKKKSNKETV